jgi:hypothetical protein
MPCTITGTLEGDRELFAKEEIAGLEKSLKESQAERLRLTKMLCVMCKIADMATKHYGFSFMPETVREWWNRHQKQDKRNRKKK